MVDVEDEFLKEYLKGKNSQGPDSFESLKETLRTYRFWLFDNDRINCIYE